MTNDRGLCLCSQVFAPTGYCPPSQSPPPVGLDPMAGGLLPLAGQRRGEMDRTDHGGSKKVCFKVCGGSGRLGSRHHELPGLLQVGAGLAWEGLVGFGVEA